MLGFRQALPSSLVSFHNKIGGLADAGCNTASASALVRRLAFGAQVGWGLLDWLTPGGTAVAVGWLVALSLAPLVRAGRLPFVRMLTPEPVADVETGGTLRIVNGVLERQ